MKTTKKEILKKIKSGKVKMKPRWRFEAVKWMEVGGWLLSMGIVILSILSVGYFIELYNPRELAMFGDLGWQIFYEDFPYLWGIMALAFLAIGMVVWINTGSNYKKSWQKNLLITLGTILVLTVLALNLIP